MRITNDRLKKYKFIFCLDLIARFRVTIRAPECSYMVSSLSVPGCWEVTTIPCFQGIACKKLHHFKHLHVFIPPGILASSASIAHARVKYFSRSDSSSNSGLDDPTSTPGVGCRVVIDSYRLINGGGKHVNSISTLATFRSNATAEYSIISLAETPVSKQALMLTLLLPFIFNLPVFTFQSDRRATQWPIQVCPRIEI